MTGFGTPGVSGSNDPQYHLFLQGILSSHQILKEILSQKDLSIEEKDVIESLEKQINSIEELNKEIIFDPKTPTFFKHLTSKFLQVIYKVEHFKGDSRLDPLLELEDILTKILKYLEDLKEQQIVKTIRIRNKELMSSLEENNNLTNEYLTKSKVLVDDLRNTTLKEIYDDEYRSHNRIAFIYELVFYCLIFFMLFYFMGIIELFPNMKVQHGIDFYIQRISILVLSTTLAAFLLKRSFANRKIAMEAFKTAKELVALPRFIEPLPQETQDKIRFDLAYKYFGNNIEVSKHNDESNLMAESIKANTEFLKAMKEIK
ncbi:hypothetical protein HLH17_11455 [Acinetobacter sp. ANC 5380]|uniref:Uncharacterized protein n=1 Tax=Acinetobacter terrae TaxID=2731247 RepID=A0A7Y2WBH3_9GAMM|nr:hypothetical protein [Acinetobacter terrae]NNH78274.1 hypothetical protein [Acinetobacter terrae]